MWYQAKTSRLKNEADYNYSTESVFDTFPWPQSPSEEVVVAVAEAARAVRAIRDEHLTKFKGGLREMYRTLALPGANPLKDAHQSLDAVVRKAYAFNDKGDLLLQLLDLNREIAAKIRSGVAVTGPGVPPSFQHRNRLLSADCITT